MPILIVEIIAKEAAMITTASDGVKDIVQSLFRTTKNRKGQGSFGATTERILHKKSSALTLSANSKNIGKIYSKLSKTGNSDALKAFRDSMVNFSKEANSTDFVAFVKTVNGASSGTLERIFTTVGEIQSTGMESGAKLGTTNWLRNIGHLSETQIGSYIDTTKSILNFEAENLESGFKEFTSNVYEIATADIPDASNSLGEYLNGVSEQSNYDEFIEFNKQFKDESEK